MGTKHAHQLASSRARSPARRRRARRSRRRSSRSASTRRRSSSAPRRRGSPTSRASPRRSSRAPGSRPRRSRTRTSPRSRRTTSTSRSSTACATRPTSAGKLLATANIGGATTRAWALFSSAGDAMQALKGKKLAFVATGCNDAGFVDNAMLESEVDAGVLRRAHRQARSDRRDRRGRVVQDRAGGVRAGRRGKGLTKVFDTGAVPNPAFVELSGKLPAGDRRQGRRARSSATAAPARSPAGPSRSRELYTALAGRLGKLGQDRHPREPRAGAHRRQGRADRSADAASDTAMVDVRHHFVRPSGDRME